MSMLNLLIFMVLFAIVFLQLLTRMLKHRQAERPELEAEPEPAPHAGFESVPVSAIPPRDVAVWPHPEAPRAHQAPHPRPAGPAVVPSPRTLALRGRPELDGVRTAATTRWMDPALRAAPLVPRDRASLRRAIVQMAILGPPRALDPAFTRRP
jgi:hypothetical protein